MFLDVETFGRTLKESQRMDALKLKINKDIVVCGPIVRQLHFTDIISLERENNLTKAGERAAGEGGRNMRNRSGKGMRERDKERERKDEREKK